jgi:hypothetical protein
MAVSSAAVLSAASTITETANELTLGLGEGTALEIVRLLRQVCISSPVLWCTQGGANTDIRCCHSLAHSLLSPSHPPSSLRVRLLLHCDGISQPCMGVVVVCVPNRPTQSSVRFSIITAASPPATHPNHPTLFPNAALTQVDAQMFAGWRAHPGLADNSVLEVRCPCFDRILHSMMPLEPTPAHLKLLHAGDQCHFSRVVTFSQFHSFYGGTDYGISRRGGG